MKIKNITPTIQVTGDFDEVMNFYVQKLGLSPRYQDQEPKGIYVAIAVDEISEPIFGLFNADYKDNRFYELNGYTKEQSYAERTGLVFHTDDFEITYQKLLDNGVVFDHKEVLSGEMDGNQFSFNIAYFTDPQGTSCSLEDGGV